MISVVIPYYNSLHDLVNCIGSLKATAKDPANIRFVVSDDCSTDTLDGLLPPDIVVVRTPQNLGFAANCNFGSSFVEGEIIALCNQDVWADGLARHWDEILERAFYEAPRIGIVGAKLLFNDGSVQHAGIQFDRDCQPYHRYLYFKNHEWRHINTSGMIPAVTGGFMVIKHEVWSALQGFDTNYYKDAYFEDVDLCLRARKMGYNIWYEAGVALRHEAGSSGGSTHFHRNAMRFKTRWVDSGFITPDSTVRSANYWPPLNKGVTNLN